MLEVLITHARPPRLCRRAYHAIQVDLPTEGLGFDGVWLLQIHTCRAEQRSQAKLGDDGSFNGAELFLPLLQSKAESPVYSELVLRSN